MKKATKQTLLRIMKHTYSVIKKQSNIVLILFVVSQLIALTLPYLSAQAFNQFIPNGSFDLVKQIVLVYAIVVVLTIITDKISRWLMGYAESKASVALMQRYREKIYGVQLRHILSLGSGRLLSKFEQGIEGQVTVFFAIIKIFVIVLVRGGVLFAIVAWKSKEVLLVLVGLTLLFALAEYVLGPKIQKITDTLRDINQEKTRSHVRFLTEQGLIRVSNTHIVEKNILNMILQKRPLLRRNQQMYGDLKEMVINVGIHAAEIIALLYLGYSIIQGDGTIADLIMITTYIRRFWRPLEASIKNINAIQKGLRNYEDLYAYIHEEYQQKDGSNIYLYKNGDITLSQVTFAYEEGKDIYSDLSLHIAGKSMIAFVGHSGSGKSTLMKLLLRMYDIKSGNILYDNQLLSDLQISSLYTHIGYVTQEPAIIDTTIRENIVYGSEGEGDENKIRESLKKAYLYDKVKDLENGLDTEVGERGIMLSGGEKQRLALARIFYKNPQYVFLDEPTSALDSASEVALSKTLHALFEGRTVIVIAHRLQTVMHADRILVFEKGKIVQDGSHKELLGQDGLYKQLVDLQSGKLHE